MDGKALPVLLRTPHFLVVDKPAGLAAHPGPTTRDSVEERLRSQARGGPWLAHRLDADTSGCLLIARRKTALIAAQQAFAERRVRKLYWAVVRGSLADEEGEISAPLLRRSTTEGWRMTVDPQGADARTRWRVLGRADGLCWLELDLLTGRTHQARAHCAALGAPILGDPIYGKQARAKDDTPLHLLARTLEVRLSDDVLRAQAPPPDVMKRTLARFVAGSAPDTPSPPF